MTGTAVPTEARPDRPRFSLRFTARDLVSVAIFAVIYIVVSYAIGMLGIISPLTWLLIIPVSIIVNGITFMLFLTRVGHAGMITLFGAIIAVFYLLTGNIPLSTAAIVLLAIVAELVFWAGRYRSTWAAIWSYTVFGLGFFTPFLPLLFDPASYFTGPSWESMGEDYLQGAQELLTAPVAGALALAIAIAGFLGGLLGSAVLRKHFVRAGLA